MKQKPRIFKPRDYISKKTGWSAFFEKNGMWYTLNLRNSRGDVVDECRCDTWADARDTWRELKARADIG